MSSLLRPDWSAGLLLRYVYSRNCQDPLCSTEAGIRIRDRVSATKLIECAAQLISNTDSQKAPNITNKNRAWGTVHSKGDHAQCQYSIQGGLFLREDRQRCDNTDL